MDETQKAAKREELRRYLGDGAFRNILVVTGLSFLAWAVGCAFLPHPGEMLLSGFVIATVLRPLLVAAFLAAWRAWPAARKTLEAMVADPDERGFTSTGVEPGIGGTFLLMAFLLGPALLLAGWSLHRQPAFTVLVWVLLVLQGLLARGLFIRFDEPLARNLTYNELWVLGALFLFVLAVFSILIGLPVALFVTDERGLGWLLDTFAVQYALAVVLLLGSHLVDLLQRVARWKLRRTRS